MKLFFLPQFVRLLATQLVSLPIQPVSLATQPISLARQPISLATQLVSLATQLVSLPMLIYLRQILMSSLPQLKQNLLISGKDSHSLNDFPKQLTKSL